MAASADRTGHTITACPAAKSSATREDRTITGLRHQALSSPGRPASVLDFPAMQIKDYTLTLKTNGFCHILDITSNVQDKIDESHVRSGVVTIFVVGATAGLTAMEYEPGLINDLEELFNRLVPPTTDYHHERTWQDGNGFSHVRASLLKPSMTIPIMNGRMRLGTWQQIALIDFDNRARDREVAVQVMGE